MYSVGAGIGVERSERLVKAVCAQANASSFGLRTGPLGDEVRQVCLRRAVGSVSCQDHGFCLQHVEDGDERRVLKKGVVCFGLF